MPGEASGRDRVLRATDSEGDADAIESAGTVRTATGVLTAALAVYNRSSAGLCDGRSEVIDEPVAGQLSGFLKGVRLLEQMRRAGHDGDTTFTP